MIRTSRCNLFLIQEGDFNDVKKLYVDNRVRKYLGGAIVDEKILRNRFQEFLEGLRNGAYHWSVKTIDKNEFIGLISLDKYHDGVNIEVSYQFLSEFWGVGYATEVISVIIEYAFSNLGLHSIVAETQTANIPSCRLLESIGMTESAKLNRFGAEQTVYKIERSYK